VKEFTGRRRVQFGETDAAGIVFYPNYFRWFDEASHDLLRHAGYSVAAMIERGYAVPIVECHARFLTPLILEDELVVASRVGEVRKRAFRVDHEIRRADEVVCEGYEVRMWVRFGESGAGVVAEPIPDELRNLLAPS
jgi:acyl-CoA thioester hydrolase